MRTLTPDPAICERFTALWVTVSQQFEKRDTGLVNARVEQLRGRATDAERGVMRAHEADIAQTLNITIEAAR